MQLMADLFTFKNDLLKFMAALLSTTVFSHISHVHSMFIQAPWGELPSQTWELPSPKKSCQVYSSIRNPVIAVIKSSAVIHVNHV